MKAGCYHEIAQRQVHQQELGLIDVMMVSAQKRCCTAPSPPEPVPQRGTKADEGSALSTLDVWQANSALAF
jgi:hypothetical protein